MNKKETVKTTSEFDLRIDAVDGIQSLSDNTRTRLKPFSDNQVDIADRQYLGRI